MADAMTPPAPTESGWLIEFTGGAPSWWDGRGPDTGMFDANEAVRFARREDAERVLYWIVTRRPAIVTEHLWS